VDNKKFPFLFNGTCGILNNNKNTTSRQNIMYRPIALVAILILPLAGCLEDPASRGLAGAAGGAIVADAFDSDVFTGALIGGLAGAASCSVNVGLGQCY